MSHTLEFFTSRIGQTIIRDGRECVIQDEKWAEQLFNTQGAYSSITDKNNLDFDLPEVQSTAPTKPRVHMASESVCVSCEG